MAASRTAMMMMMMMMLAAGAEGVDPVMRLRTPDGPVYMPQLAVGVWELSADEVETAIAYALDAGFTHVDTANDYENQEAVGEAIRKHGQRSDVFLTTKVPGCDAQSVDECADSTAADINDDLAQLKVERVDLLLLHFPPRPFPYTHTHCPRMRAQWRALEDAYYAGKARAIGVSNFCPSCLECIAPSHGGGTTIVPAVNQVQYHVGMGPDQGGIASACAARGIVLQAYSPLGDGRSRELITGPLVTGIGKENGRSGAQTSLRYVAQLGLALVTKSTSKRHLSDDAAIFDFALTGDQMSRLLSATSPAANYSFACVH